VESFRYAATPLSDTRVTIREPPNGQEEEGCEEGSKEEGFEEEVSLTSAVVSNSPIEAGLVPASMVFGR
jgi:hypothetical protein